MTTYSDFIGQVQHRIEADSQADAVRTTRAVLEALGERLEAGAATDLASSLPTEIDRYLLTADHGHSYGYTSFVDNVLERLNYDDIDLDVSYGTPAAVERGDAVYQIRAVVALLEETVPGGAMADLEAQLPDEFEDIFEFVGVETPPWDA